MQVKEIIFDPSTIETIDMGLYNWADNTLALHTTTQFFVPPYFIFFDCFVEYTTWLISGVQG